MKFLHGYFELQKMCALETNSNFGPMDSDEKARWQQYGTDRQTETTDSETAELYTM